MGKKENDKVILTLVLLSFGRKTGVANGVKL